MKYITKLKMASVHQWCDVEDKSTEFTIQFIQDTCKVSHDTVMAYFAIPFEKKQKLFNDLNSLIDTICLLG